MCLRLRSSIIIAEPSESNQNTTASSIACQPKSGWSTQILPYLSMAE
jgi:hypothetical protein